MDIIRRKPRIGDIKIPAARTWEYGLVIFLKILAVVILLGGVVATGILFWPKIWSIKDRLFHGVAPAAQENSLQRSDYAAVGGAPVASQGMVSGTLCMTAGATKNIVVAKNIHTGDLYQLAVTNDASSFSFSLTPGSYFLRLQSYNNMAHPEQFTSVYYTSCAVTAHPSAESCSNESHALLPVTVTETSPALGINLCDSYFGKSEPTF